MAREKGEEGEERTGSKEEEVYRRRRWVGGGTERRGLVKNMQFEKEMLISLMWHAEVGLERRRRSTFAGLLSLSFFRFSFEDCFEKLEDERVLLTKDGWSEEESCDQPPY